MAVKMNSKKRPILFDKQQSTGCSNYFILTFKIALACNLFSVLFNILNDCDEVYNYWEPLHFIVTLGRGGGFQTWEYSPNNALRSYFYLWLFGWPAFLTNTVGLPAYFGFLAIRLKLALLSAMATALLANVLQKVCRPLDQSYWGIPVSILFVGFTALSPGNFISSTTLVPSGLASTFCALLLYSWLSEWYLLAVGCVAYMGIILWPFAALLGVPLVAWMILTNHFQKLVIHSILWAIILTLPMVIVDSIHFGQITVAPFNIIRYNVFSHANKSDGSSASQLYGVEPVSFYAKNYLLNYNILIPLSFGCFVVAILRLVGYGLNLRNLEQHNHKESKFAVVLRSYFICLTPLLLWNCVFFLQQHKEERFLFPCYPCLVMSACLFVHELQTFFSVRRFGKICCGLCRWLIIGVITVFILLSAARIAALIRWYSAPMFLTKHSVPPTLPSTFCLGREWHYFPSRFLLPRGDLGSTNLWRVGFLPSQFKGQLPGQYKTLNNGKISFLDSTRLDGNRFNLWNLEEPDRYLTPSECDYLLDRDSPVFGREELYVNQINRWVSVVNKTTIEADSCQPVDVSKAFFSSRFSGIICPFLRSFYIPFVSEVFNKPVHVHILRRLNFSA